MRWRAPPRCTRRARPCASEESSTALPSTVGGGDSNTASTAGSSASAVRRYPRALGWEAVDAEHLVGTRRRPGPPPARGDDAPHRRDAPRRPERRPIAVTSARRARAGAAGSPERPRSGQVPTTTGMPSARSARTTPSSAPPTGTPAHGASRRCRPRRSARPSSARYPAGMRGDLRREGGRLGAHHGGRAQGVPAAPLLARFLSRGGRRACRDDGRRRDPPRWSRREGGAPQLPGVFLRRHTRSASRACSPEGFADTAAGDGGLSGDEECASPRLPLTRAPRPRPRPGSPVETSASPDDTGRGERRVAGL